MTNSSALEGENAEKQLRPPKRQKLRRKMQRQHRHRNLSADSFPLSGDVIPEGQLSCLRVSKQGRGDRERRRSGIVSAEAALSRRGGGRSRRAKRRPPPPPPMAGSRDSNRNRAESPEEFGQWQSESSEQGAVTAVGVVVAAPAPVPALSTRRPVGPRQRSSTAETRSPGSKSTTVSEILSSVGVENAAVDSDCKWQYILHCGRMRPVQVMKWPEKLRIPLTERYREEEPLKHRYGRRSILHRLVRGLEQSRPIYGQANGTDLRRPIPLLPKHLMESTKNRLLLWYKQLDSTGESDAAPGPASVSAD